jgi:hypothetical protein
MAEIQQALVHRQGLTLKACLRIYCIHKLSLKQSLAQTIFKMSLKFLLIFS